MGTFLFDKIIFGPVKSRRLGVSLGVNLMPIDKKICTFDCIYCECGFNGKGASESKIPSRQDVKNELQKVLQDMQTRGEAPDVITYAGNGEPTIHKDFAAIIDDTIELRDKYFPKARIAVLSNATMLHKPDVVEALKKIDDNIQKLDSGLEERIMQIDQPVGKFSLSELVNNLLAFEGKLIIQTMFLRGNYNGNDVDNTTKDDVDAWLEIVKKVSPKSVMIYTIDRDTPAQGLLKVSRQELDNIAQKVEALGISTQVSG